MENSFWEVGLVTLNKHGETICGDFYELRREDGRHLTAVLSDGLGSGIKANILSTLTCKIITTLMARRLPIDTCVDTVARTLPVCKTRRLAYATFTALRLEGRHGYLAQYDNPPAIFLRNGVMRPYDYRVRFVGEKEIHECEMDFELGDLLVMMSDGVTNAGIGKTMPAGWHREDVIKLLEDWYTPDISAQNLAVAVSQAALQLSLDELDDDVTVLALKLRERRAVNLMVGPPEKKDEDDKIIKLFFGKAGKHVVCGGTTAHAVSKYLNKPILPLIETCTEELPAMAIIEGVDLVTEGVLTLRKTVELIKRYREDCLFAGDLKNGKDGASRLARLLIEEATDVNIFFGVTVNKAHDMLDIDFDTKLQLMQRLSAELSDMGKNVKVSMC